MPDYKEMYLTMVRETEKAIRILEAAQLRCEELYLQSEEPQLVVLPRQDTNQNHRLNRWFEQAL